ncbi:16S rRNA (cytidine(1402)-2'-O)-methyltransferase [uncultured Megasphaera sp.]|uniref:16S rRNA (cytidine(1402)-2'-O)-methyltransferase n=1 Tax=uncultured Megasphaera sp. TaxID=165188 RepID=UPI0012E0F3F2|nr:16S rRNA (cytidine(1402)-2'-O)-methyltransferase [uncultured Megasphaera sp.]MUP58834.1 16S rRNA (cytidine(1402)-2'-O)-methyltransferase [Veillonellaceae bacterium M2-4]
MAEVFQKGTLYLCPTPIGNLEDITYRTVRCLQSADVIAAEDTRHTKQLLEAYQIETPLTSYYEHNKLTKGPKLIERLQAGEMIALVSDAGMPAICDPGSDLVRLALQHSIRVVPLPGANAGLTGLIASGMDTTRFTFIGFLPKTKKHRIPVLRSLQEIKGTLIFYEAPHRLRTVLQEMQKILGSRAVVICRELTKRYEEYLRGTLDNVLELFSEDTYKGEFVILIEGMQETCGVHWTKEDYIEKVQKLTEQGIKKKAAIRMVAIQLGVPKRDVYQATIQTADYHKS